MNQWLDVITSGDLGGSAAAPTSVLLALVFAFLVGQFIGFIYMITHRGLSYSQSFVGALVILPVIVSLMMLLMAGSIAVAFGLLAVFAVVRFRNVLKDTRDTVFILWTITEGLAVGTMRLSTAAVGAIAIGAILVYLWITQFGARHRFDAMLSLRLGGPAGSIDDSMAALRGVLRRHCAKSLADGHRTLTEDGLSMTYRLLMRNPEKCDLLRDELDAVTGIENVSLLLRRDESEM